jgi:hypothetical protein
MAERISHPAVLNRYEGSAKITVPDPAPEAVITEERLYRLDTSHHEETRLYTEDGRAKMAGGSPGAVLHSRCSRCHRRFDVVYLLALAEDVPRDDSERFCWECYEHEHKSVRDSEAKGIAAVRLRKPFEAMEEFVAGSVPVPPEIFQGVVLLSQDTIDAMTDEELVVLERFCAQYEASWQADGLLGPDEMAFRRPE